MRKWRNAVGQAGIDLTDGGPNLLDLRFADDILAQKVVTAFSFTLFFAYRCASKTEIGQQKGDSQPTRRTRAHLGHITLEVRSSSRLVATTQGVHCHQGLSFILEPEVDCTCNVTSHRRL